ncbi:hypothetical protein [Gluconobacter oxydans]|uniref:hypothetical protein n=1 Tax=Gluconobacter oxydans TaxID=442 RepID=UPI0039E8A373
MVNPSPNETDEKTQKDAPQNLSDCDKSSKPICLIGGGRGGRGKTSTQRWLYERAHNAGRSVLLADGDHTNQSLRGFFPEASSPPSAEPAAVGAWFEAEIERASTTAQSLIVDFGGGDQTIKKMSRELSLVESIQEAGLTPVALYCIGGDPDDLGALYSLYDAFAPPATLIVFSRFALPSHIDAVSWLETAVSQHEPFQAILNAGAELVPVPTLSCAHRLSERRLKFFDALSGAGSNPLGVFDRQRVQTWMREMETSFARVTHYLP